MTTMVEQYQLVSTVVLPTGAVRATVRLVGGRLLTVNVPRSRSSADDIRETILAAVATNPPPVPPSP